MHRFVLALTTIMVGSAVMAGNHYSRSCTDPGFSNQCETLEEGGTLSDQECMEIVNNMGSEGTDGAANGINDSCCDSSIKKVFPGFDDNTDACENFDVKLISGGAEIQVEVDIDEDTCSGADCGPTVCGHRQVLFESFLNWQERSSSINF